MQVLYKYHKITMAKYISATTRQCVRYIYIYKIHNSKVGAQKALLSHRDGLCHIQTAEG